MTVRKNWARIAACSNQALRHLLVQAKGEIALGLAKGFPQYFLADGEEITMPTRAAFLSMMEDVRRHDDVVTICRQLGIPHHLFVLDGYNCGSRGGVPRVYKEDPEYFYCSWLHVGEETEYEDAKWIIAYNHLRRGGRKQEFDFRGSIAVPANHRVVIVASDAFAK